MIIIVWLITFIPFLILPFIFEIMDKRLEKKIRQIDSDYKKSLMEEIEKK